TGCADGSPYAYFVREGDPARLLVFLQGGGACWSALGCDPGALPTYDGSVGPEDDPGAGADGILALGDARNPFRGWSALFVSYCTGDVHLGDAPRTYPLVTEAEAAPGFVAMHHRGRANAEAALAWAFDRAPPERVFVTGESAGAIASPYWAAVVAARWPEARVAQLGDAAGGYRAGAVPDLLRTWGAVPALREALDLPPDTAETPDFEAIYTGAGRRHPELGLARLDRAEDLVQRFFLTEVGVFADPLHALLRANLARIREKVPRVRQYLAPGPVHTTLASPAFHTLEVRGTALRDWVEAHAAGKPVSDVICEGCAAP
ncbi:MAG: pectin acetylesterase-family hydrolase, partial [Myxococcota bacterium]|nr:pectin acetylesterase-family hydrolase [Myxococcota bacterium]